VAENLTRTGVRRAGDDYQDIVALDVLVEWLEHLRRVMDEMDLRVSSFEHQIVTPRLLVLTVDEHSTLDGDCVSQVKHFDR